MTEVTTLSPKERPPLPPARPDFTSSKVQTIWGACLALVFTLLLYSGSLESGFLQGDSLILHPVLRALTGDSGDLFKAVTGGDGAPGGYHPSVLISLFIDGLIFKASAWGFHFTNVILTWGTALFLSLLCLELTALTGNRLRGAASAWTAFLFCAYPAHVAATVLVSGRIEVLCTLFCVSSIFFYFRYRSCRDGTYLLFSLTLFALALFSSEAAMTLPLVVALAETLLGARIDDQTGLRRASQAVAGNRMVKRTAAALFFWFVLGFFAAARSMMMGGCVQSASSELQLLAFERLLEKQTLLKIIFPANDQLHYLDGLRPLLTGSYIAVVASAVLRLFSGSINCRVFLFLAGWIILQVLPLSSSWHIGPDLRGSQLAFGVSAPLSILLVLLALPAIDVIKKRFAVWFTVAGCVSLSVILVVWTGMLEVNLESFKTAGLKMQALLNEVQKELRVSSGTGSYVLFLNLPAEYMGVGMFERQKELERLVAPPFASADLRRYLRVVDFPDGKKGEPFQAGCLPRLTMDPLCRKVLIWSPAESLFKEYSGTSGGGFAFDFKTFHDSVAAQRKVQLLPSYLVPVTSGHWLQENGDHLALEQTADALRIKSGRVPLLLRWDGLAIDPLKYDVVDLDARARGACAGLVKLRWQADSGPEGDPPPEGEVACEFDAEGKASAIATGRYSRWSLSRRITALELVFEPGDYEVDLRELKAGAALTSPVLTPPVGSVKLTPGESGKSDVVQCYEVESKITDSEQDSGKGR